MDDQKSFNYTISQKNRMLVVSLIGEMPSYVVPALEACRQELLGKHEVSCVVIYFQNVEQMSPEAIATLAQIQREIRAKPADIRICSLKENLREKLVRMGVVRSPEVATDLRSALLSLTRAA